ncbi:MULTISPECIES: hypothetical protein [Halorubrum]|uniref:Uncharacterized protein n=1 Tax=Halorubrum tropicale TaxID=1765655 RepID=A0A0N0UAD3_9EURY|nr:MULTISPECIES: hypothetical protein [Halorubrum]KOX96114.1 hypothetical protein AMR74_11290 [Halorubrum tropicale]RLM52087.1 hypothetical protein DVK06_00905 [Halorubrum sp. Atlit-28R]TKX45891.1 hypothetical protein EXE50_01430 [Halorubrum sp. ARQ200]TKX51062.1 hypothetical protein EXE49_02230 [Halorubrum sp. ASP121]TKX61778.1 hypothetical protein EXE48_08240 [Halorubrum sp. ASP1]
MTDGGAADDETGGDGSGGSRRDDERDGDEEEPDRGHLDDVEDGAGCTEIWERLSERREE